MTADEIATLFIETRGAIYAKFHNSTARVPNLESIAVMVGAEIQARATEKAAADICKAIEEWSR